MEESSQGKYIRVEKISKIYVYNKIYTYMEGFYSQNKLSIKIKNQLILSQNKRFKFIYPGWAASV